MIVGAGALLVTALHPAGSDFFSSFHVSRLHGAMVAPMTVAAAGLVPLAVATIRLQVAVADDHAAAGHYGFMAAFAVTTHRRGRARQLATRRLATSGLDGRAAPGPARGHLDHLPAGDLNVATPWALAAITWGALFITVTHLAHEHRNAP